MDQPPRRKPFRIFIDDLKIRHTSHWDEDFMSREELDAAYGKQADAAAGGAAPAAAPSVKSEGGED